jgi:hypothetical protein
VPGRKPGTSTKVTIGMLKESQNLTNLAAFTEASISKQPAKFYGWFPTIPTTCPSTSPKPVRMFFAKSGIISKN